MAENRWEGTRTGGRRWLCHGENRNGPTAGRPRWQSLISTLVFSLFLFFSFFFFVFFLSSHPTPPACSVSAGDGIRPCMVVGNPPANTVSYPGAVKNTEVVRTSTKKINEKFYLLKPSIYVGMTHFCMN